MTTEKRLPFRLFDSLLDRMKSLTDASTDVAKVAVSRPAERPDGVPPGPKPSETATAAPALATALDEKARDAIAKHVGANEVSLPDQATVDRTKTDQPAPARKAGVKPFTPQVGP